MSTFLMFGKYSAGAIKEVSPARTQQAVDLIKKQGVQVKAMFACLGEVDLVLVLELPGIAEALKVSVALGKQTGIAFTTAPAVTVEEFDRLIAQV